MYSREDETGWRQSAAFKKAFSIDVDIELLAVWWVNSHIVCNLPFQTPEKPLQGHRWFGWGDPAAAAVYNFQHSREALSPGTCA